MHGFAALMIVLVSGVPFALCALPAFSAVTENRLPKGFFIVPAVLYLLGGVLVMMLAFAYHRYSLGAVSVPDSLKDHFWLAEYSMKMYLMNAFIAGGGVVSMLVTWPVLALILPDKGERERYFP